MTEDTTGASLCFEEIFLGFLVALAAGALIGLEREQSGGLDHKRRLGGVRTFPLIALSGALSAFLAYGMGVWPVLVALLVVGAFLAVAYYHERSHEGLPGVTTEVAALITFLLGVLALLPELPLTTGERYLLIVASAGVVMALLSFKEPLHQAVARLSADDIYATAKFVILALVVLPLLPDRTYGPFQVLNPFDTGVMVVLIAAISFVGYITARVVGERKSLAVTGIIGGVVSSTAVTISLASRVRKAPAGADLVAVAVLAASGTTLLRMLLIVGIVDLPLLAFVLPPLGAMAMATYAMALFLLGRLRRGDESEPVSYRNPFELRWALQFGLIYAVVIFAAKATHVFFDEAGLYVSSLVAGLANVDAITLSMTRFHKDGLAVPVAVTALSLAAFTSLAAKAGLVLWFGHWTLAKQVFPGLGAALLTGAVLLMLLW